MFAIGLTLRGGQYLMQRRSTLADLLGEGRVMPWEQNAPNNVGNRRMNGTIKRPDKNTGVARTSG